MSNTNEELVNQILPLLRLARPAERSKMRLELQAHTLAELKAFLDVVSSRKYQAELAELADEAILKIQAERAADFAIFQLERDRQTAPQRTREAKAQLEQDKESFAKICRQNSLSECQANFQLFQSTHSISGLAPASQEELARWNAEAAEKRRDFLVNRATPDQLKTAVRQEATDSRAANAKAETDRQLEALRTKDAPFGYQPLPTEFTKDSLLQLVQQDTKKYRYLIQKFGNYNVTARLQGRA